MRTSPSQRFDFGFLEIIATVPSSIIIELLDATVRMKGNILSMYTQIKNVIGMDIFALFFISSMVFNVWNVLAYPEYEYPF